MVSEIATGISEIADPDGTAFAISIPRPRPLRQHAPICFRFQLPAREADEPLEKVRCLVDVITSRGHHQSISHPMWISVCSVFFFLKSVIECSLNKSATFSYNTSLPARSTFHVNSRSWAVFPFSNLTWHVTVNLPIHRVSVISRVSSFYSLLYTLWLRTWES